MKLYRNIIIFVAVIAVLCAAIFLISKYLPENEESVTSQQPAEDEMFSVFKVNSDMVSKMHIKNANEEYTLELNGDNWILNGDASIRLKQTSVESLVYVCTSVSVKKIVAETDEQAADFGFSDPIGYVELSLTDGTVKRITIGNKTLDGQDYYVMLSDDPKIYLKNTYGTESLIPSIQSLRDLSLITVDPANLSNLQHVYIAKQGNTSIKLENVNVGTKDEPNYQWKMLEPVYAEMNGQNFVNDVVNCFENFEAEAVMEDHAKDLSVYGLDTPVAEFSVATTEKTLRMSVGGETESYRFVMEQGSDTVYAMPKSSLTFLDVAYVDLMSNLIHVEYINTIKKVEVVSGNTKYDMEIHGEEGNQTYTINGVTIQKEAFSKAYQAVIGISLESVDLSEEPNIAPEAYVRYTKIDGSTVLVNFLPVDERNFRVTIDGKGNSITSKKNFESVLTKIQDTIDNAQ